MREIQKCPIKILSRYKEYRNSQKYKNVYKMKAFSKTNYQKKQLT